MLPLIFVFFKKQKIGLFLQKQKVQLAKMDLHKKRWVLHRERERERESLIVVNWQSKTVLHTQPIKIF